MPKKVTAPKSKRAKAPAKKAVKKAVKKGVKAPATRAVRVTSPTTELEANPTIVSPLSLSALDDFCDEGSDVADEQTPVTLTTEEAVIGDEPDNTTSEIITAADEFDEDDEDEDLDEFDDYCDDDDDLDDEDDES